MKTRILVVSMAVLLCATALQARSPATNGMPDAMPVAPVPATGLTPGPGTQLNPVPCHPTHAGNTSRPGSTGTQSGAAPGVSEAPCVDASKPTKSVKAPRPGKSGSQSGKTPGTGSITEGTDGTSGDESRSADPAGSSPGVPAGGETLDKGRPTPAKP
jgi:hypothetical protein